MSEREGLTEGQELLGFCTVVANICSFHGWLPPCAMIYLLETRQDKTRLFSWCVQDLAIAQEAQASPNGAEDENEKLKVRAGWGRNGRHVCHLTTSSDRGFALAFLMQR